jgi:hypothetical protein
VSKPLPSVSGNPGLRHVGNLTIIPVFQVLRKSKVYDLSLLTRSSFVYGFMTRGEHLKYCIAFALIGVSTIVRGMWRTLTDQERSALARRTVDKLKEHGDKWRLDEDEPVNPLDGAHSSPSSFTEAHEHKKDRS